MAKKTKSTEVPGQYYGYSLQVTRALAHLLKAGPGLFVSVEHLDDVSTISPDGVKNEQDKSGLAHNPITNRSVELWKTLYNWLTKIRLNPDSIENTNFVLFVAQPYSGQTIEQINNASNFDDASKLLIELRNLYWGKDAKRSLKPQIVDSLAQYLNDVLETSDELLARFFIKVKLEVGSGSPNSDLEQEIEKKAISKKAVKNVLIYLLGWVKKEVDSYIEKNQPAIIPYDHFHDALVASAKIYDRNPNVLHSVQKEITSEEIKREVLNRTYVKQLNIISLEQEQIEEAVNCFLLSAADRTAWAEECEVVESGFEDFKQKLISHWNRENKTLPIKYRFSDDIDIGVLLNAACLGYSCKLSGRDLPHHFIPGSFHTLAENLEIGWHPKYKKLILKQEI